MLRRVTDPVLCVLVSVGLLGPSPILAESSVRKVSAHGIRFLVPSDTEKSSFKATPDGRKVLSARIGVSGLGRLTVIINPRGDPGATLQNEINGAEASAQTKVFRKSRVRAIPINRGQGVEGLISQNKAPPTAYCITWTKNRQFELMLEASKAGTNPLVHPVWRRLQDSFRTDEPPLK